MSVFHIHHIIPKHRWKELHGSLEGINVPWNIIRLTVPEHAEYHRRLWEEWGRWQDELAWKTLTGQITNAESIKEAQRRGQLGKPKSEETKKRMSIALTNPSEETRSKMRDAKRNYVPWNKGKKTNLIPWNKGIKTSLR